MLESWYVSLAYDSAHEQVDVRKLCRKAIANPVPFRFGAEQHSADVTITETAWGSRTLHNSPDLITIPLDSN